MNIPAGYVQVNHFFTGTAFPRGAQVTYGVDWDAGASLASLASDLDAAFKTRFQSAMGTSTTHAKLRCKAGPNDTGPFVETSPSWAGTYNTAWDSPQVALLVRKNTTVGGRTGAGRLFMPLVAEADSLTGGTFDPTALAAIQSRLTTWLSDIAALAHTTGMFLLHNSIEETPSEVVSLSAASQLATQRRRLRKVGGRRRVV